MAELNEYECEMLDVLLESFGVPDSLTREQVMTLFDGDEAEAYRMVQVLLREELVIEVGEHGSFDLPQKVVLKPKGEKFLNDGGFSKRHRVEQQKPVEVGGTLGKLQQQNMRLQNLRLSNETEIGQLKKIVSNLEKRQYILLISIIAALVIGVFIGMFLKH